MTAKPENPPATDTAKAIELLRQQVESGLWVGRATQADLVECFAAAVKLRTLENDRDLRGDILTVEIPKARAALDTAIAKVCKGVLSND